MIEPREWSIEIFNVTHEISEALHLEFKKEYWGFDLKYKGNLIGSGSADDVSTCASMAQEMLEYNILEKANGC